jgi:hypothetical protein
VYSLFSYYFYGFAGPLCGQGEYIVTIVELTILNSAGRAPERKLCGRRHNNFRYHFFYSYHAIFQESKPASLKIFESHLVPCKEKSASENLRAVLIHCMFTWSVEYSFDSFLSMRKNVAAMRRSTGSLHPWLSSCP